MPDLSAISTLIPTLGPVGAVLVVVLWFYRKDVVEQQRRIAEGRDKLIEAMTENTSALTRLADRLSAHEAHEREMIDTLGAKIEHAINNGFHTFRLTLLEKGR